MIYEQIRFRDLSVPLKIAIIGAYIIMGLYVLLFLIGFAAGILGV